jgi:glucokinase
MGDKTKRYTIGIDIGGTKILLAVLDSRFQILSVVKMKTQTDQGARAFIKAIGKAAKSALRDAHVDRSDVLAAGAGCPGMIDPKSGIVRFSPNIPFLKNFPLAQKLSRELGCPVVVGNDVQTGMIGEHQFGAAKGYRNAVGIFLGTGVGGAIILNGELYRGASGSAGEVGHLLIDPEGPLCGCGNRGCLESLTGRTAIAAEAAILVARQRAPHLAAKAGTDIRAIKSGAMAKAIRQGDRALEELIRHKAQLVGHAMASLVNVLNPEIVVLGGGVMEAMGRIILREADRSMRQRALGPSAKNVKVAAAKLGDYSIVMGAAKRAKDQFGKS